MFEQQRRYPLIPLWNASDCSAIEGTNFLPLHPTTSMGVAKRKVAQPAWADKHGSKRCESLEGIAPFAGQRWVTEWAADKSGSQDADGWWYAVDYGGADVDWQPTVFDEAFVRRRRWVRTQDRDPQHLARPMNKLRMVRCRPPARHCEPPYSRAAHPHVGVRLLHAKRRAALRCWLHGGIKCSLRDSL